MTDKLGAHRERLLGVTVSILFFTSCSSPSSGGTSGTGGSGGTAPGSGSSGSSGSAGASGAGGGLKDGGTGGGGTAGGGQDGGQDGGPFACPTLPAPGSCAPPVDIRCPYPKLSQTGCIDPSPFSDSKLPIKMASVVVPYEVNSPLWSDGALKTRGMRLPTGGKIHVKDCAQNPTECGVLDPATFKCCLPPADDGKWVFPAGTVMVKNFMFPDASRPSGYKLIETRLFGRAPPRSRSPGITRAASIASLATCRSRPRRRPSVATPSGPRRLR